MLKNCGRTFQDLSLSLNIMLVCLRCRKSHYKITLISCFIAGVFFSFGVCILTKFVGLYLKAVCSILFAALSSAEERICFPGHVGADCGTGAGKLSSL